jgi:hypothetical protein
MPIAEHQEQTRPHNGAAVVGNSGSEPLPEDMIMTNEIDGILTLLMIMKLCVQKLSRDLRNKCQLTPIRKLQP